MAALGEQALGEFALGGERGPADPNNGAIGEFALGEEPLGDELADVLIINVDSPIEMALDVPGPEVTGAGATSINIDSPVEVALTVNDVTPVYTIQPAPIEMALEFPGPEVTGAGSVAIDVDSPLELALAVDDAAIGYPYWAVDGTPVDRHVDERRDWQRLSLVWRVDNATKDATLSPLQNTANKYDIVPASDGSFSTLDRAATDGTVTLKPPVGREPPREERDYVVDQYSQRQVDRAGASHEVDVSFVALSNRDPDGSASNETRESDEWSFAFRAATIATSRVEVDIGTGTDTGADTVDLQLILDATQTKVLEESATRLEAVSVREVSDGANSVDDDSASPANANQVTVTTPDGESPISDGTYVVMDWQTEWLSDRAFRVTLTLGDPNP